jgi:hypothetical protein
MSVRPSDAPLPCQCAAGWDMQAVFKVAITTESHPIMRKHVHIILICTWCHSMQ